MINIGFDARFAFGEKRGIGIYSINLITQLILNNNTNNYYLFVDSDDYIKDSFFAEKNVYIIKLPIAFYPIWEQVLLPIYAKMYNLDILHCLGNTAPLFNFKSYKLICTIHDVFYMKHFSFNKTPFLKQKLGRFYRKVNVPRIVNKCDAIITVSNFSRNDICNELNITNKEVDVTYLGVSKLFEGERHIEKKDILKIGMTITGKDPQKNVINLIKSLEQIFDNKLLDKFIIVGIKKNDFYEYLPLKYLEKIEIIEFSTQKEIKNLLQEVYVFVFVSFYESFGIPALEAMKCGVPVIVSNTGALPEILNEQSMTIDPLDIFDGMKKILVKLLDNQEYEKLSRKMFLRSKDFDYMITAHNTNIIYKRVLSKVGNEIE